MSELSNAFNKLIGEVNKITAMPEQNEVPELSDEEIKEMEDSLNTLFPGMNLGDVEQEDFDEEPEEDAPEFPAGIGTQVELPEEFDEEPKKYVDQIMELPEGEPVADPELHTNLELVEPAKPIYYVEPKLESAPKSLGQPDVVSPDYGQLMDKYRGMIADALGIQTDNLLGE